MTEEAVTDIRGANVTMSLIAAGQDSEESGCDIDVSLVRYVYVLIAIVGAVVSCVYCATFVTNEPSLRAEKKAKQHAQQASHEPREGKSCVKPVIKLGAVGIYFFIMFVTYIPSTFLSAFAIRGLGWGVNAASLLSSLFGGTQCIGRMIAVPLVYIWTPTKFYSTTLVIAAAAYILMALTPILRTQLMWVSVALAGVSCSPLNSTLVIWLGQYVTITSALGSANLMAASVAGFTGTLLMGRLFNLDHMWMVYFSLAGLTIIITIFLLLTLFLKVTDYGRQLKTAKTQEIESLKQKPLQDRQQFNQQLVSSQMSLY